MNKEKKLGGFSLFNLWSGAAISIAEIMTGSLIAPLGILKGISVILAGHIVGCLILGAVGIIGFKEKQPAIISSRISLGKYGSYLISIFNIIQLVGWTAIMLIQCTRSVEAITSGLFGLNNFVLLLILTAALIGFWTFYADKGISFINNLAVVMLFILSTIMLFSILKTGHVKPITGAISVGSALELSIIMPLSWVPLISDYTMSAKSAKGSFYGTFLGYFIGSCFMYIIGLISSIYTGTSDPAAILVSLGMGYPAILVVVLSTVTTSFLDVYSSVLSTLNLAPKASKKLLIIVFTVLGAILGLYFPMEQYQNFLYMIGSIFAPVFSVILIDYFVYKKDWRNETINIWGILSASVGTLSYYIIIKYDFYIGSTIPCMVITVITYSILRFISNKVMLGDANYVK